MSMTKDDWFKWAVGIGGSLVTALVIYMFTFFVSFETRVAAIAQTVHDNGGVTPGEITEIKTLLGRVDEKIEAGESDRNQIREDIRQIVEILSR